MQLMLLSEDMANPLAAPASIKEMPIASMTTSTDHDLTSLAALVHSESGDGDADEKNKSPGAFKTISEAAQLLGVPQHVLRFWESKFPQIKPMKMRGGRRYYRPEDIDILSRIQHLLYTQGYTIKGAKQAFLQEARAKKAGTKAPDSMQGSQPDLLTPIAPPAVATIPAPPSAAAHAMAVAPVILPEGKINELLNMRHELAEMRELLGLYLQ